MPAPYIGITCSTSALDPRAENAQDRLNAAYFRAVAACGGVPLMLPNLSGETLAHAWLDRIDGLLLSGGADLAPALYGEEILNGTVEVDHRRDDAELPLIRQAVARDVPLLAICRGIQSLNVALGGSLWQDIPEQTPSPVRHRQSAARHEPTHSIRISPDSRMSSICSADSVMVNSMHHQAIRNLGRGLKPVAWAEDGLVEAVEREGARFTVGVQYHPEELVLVTDDARRLFEAFVDAATA